MVAKALLPNFGGSSLVWNVCLLFFQAALLAGYGYANVLTRKADVRRAAPIHWVVASCALVACATLFVPSGLWQVRPAPEASPLLPLLTTLALTTAAPFIVLAAGTPLIQRWFAHSDDPSAHDPYFLYAASNLGSFCGLIAYPTLVEPRLPLAGQREFVSVLFFVYAILLVVAGLIVRTHVAKQTADAPAQPQEPIAGRSRLTWAALSAGPSALLLAVTSDLTKNIAPIPLLWVAPLGLYLLTFVIVFSNRARKLEAAGGSPIWLRILLALALAANSYLIFLPTGRIYILLPIALCAFFLLTLACHLQLARLRPQATQLTEYYLWVSIGGVIGGLFCAVLAPLIFTGLTELPVSLGLCVALYGFVQMRRAVGVSDILASATGGVLVAGLALYWSRNSGLNWELSAAIAVVFAVMCYWPHRFAIVYLAYLGFFAFADRHQGDRLLFAQRNYYGFESVVQQDVPALNRLINGNITHGNQYRDAKRKHEPSTYYGKAGPLGQALLPTFDSHPNAAVGAVGLGTGTEAAYGRPGMKIDFYELNPTVKRIATDPNLFSYVLDSAAKINIILGDARLSMANAPDGSYDVIILDAFSSDSIPVHLLTREAFQLDVAKLKPDGIILVHASNRYLALPKFVSATAASVGLVSDLAEDSETDYLRWPTTWLCLARSRERLKAIESSTSLWAPYSAEPGTRGWTDDYSNVFGALKILNK